MKVQFDDEDLRVVVQAISETADVYDARAADDKQYTGEQRNDWEQDAGRLRSIHARMAKLVFDIDKGGACETQTWTFGARPDPDELVTIDSAWLLKFVETKAAALVETVRRKNADYSGAAPDPFGNFRNVEDLGIATVEQGFLTRMTDKLARAASLTKPGKVAQVKDESVEDTLFDLAAYSFLLAAYRASVRLSREGRTLP
jgi:hypothetical protein